MKTNLSLTLCRLIVGLSLFSIICSVQAEKSKDSEKPYLMFVGPFLQAGIIGPGTKEVAYQLSTEDGKTPPAGPKLEILFSKGTIVIESDREGIIRLPYSLELVEENPTVRKRYKEVLSFEVWLTGSFKSDSSKNVELSYKNKPSIESENIRIWYPADHHQKAKKLMPKLEKQRDFIQKQLGLEPMPWGINLIETKDPKVNDITIQEFPRWITWSYSLNEMNKIKFVQTNIHEWTEATLDRRLGLHHADSEGRNRFILDGLADYLKIRYTKKVRKDYMGMLEPLLEKNEIQVNLIESFKSLHFSMTPTDGPIRKQIIKHSWLPGYPLSFVFWERLCREHGRDLPKKFIQSIQKKSKRDFESCIESLEKIIGEPIRSQLENVDVKSAMDLIQEYPTFTP